MYKSIHPLLLLSFFMMGLSAFSQPPSKETFLQNNHTSLDIDNPGSYTAFKLLDSDIVNYDVFIIGEFHGLEVNSKISIQLIRYLNGKMGKVVLVLEYPLSLETMVNKFVLYGDSIARQHLLHLIPNSYSLLLHIYEINQRLPIDKRIRVATVDSDSNWNLPILALKELFSNSAVPKEIEQNVHSLLAFPLPENLTFQEYPDRKYKKLGKALAKDMKENEVLYRELLKEKFFHAQRIVEGFNLGMNYSSKRNSNKEEEKREEFMYENFRVVLENNPGAKFIGKFGKAHVVRDSSILWRRVSIPYPLAARLHNYSDSPSKGRVCSIGIDYLDLKDDFSAIQINELPNFLKFCQSNVTAFKLEGDKTPFVGWSKSFQYLIVVRD